MDRNIDSKNQHFSQVNIYIDLCNAFDCLDHAILLSKLKYYGLNDNAIKLSQGSVMGPLLFNIVINDLPSATKNFDFVMYADDTRFGVKYCTCT